MDAAFGKGRAESPDAPSIGRLGSALLLTTVFASGTAVMIVEMTAVRAVQPFFGSTTYVWTNVIAVVLAALAIGYALGGHLADRRPSLRLLFGLVAAGGVLVAACALLVTPVSRLFLQDGVDLEGVVSVLLWGSLGTALVLFAPPILLLGTIAPIAIRLLAVRGVGRAAGSVFALSTLGSILGTYLPTLVLVPHLGSRGSILVAAGILLVMATVGLLASARAGGEGAAMVCGLLGALALSAASRRVPPGRPAPRLDGGTAKVLEEAESSYQYLTVRDDDWSDGRARVLTINEGVYTFHAFDVPGRVLTGSRFYDAYSVVPFLLELAPGAPLRLCVVGMACGVNASQWHHFFSAAHRVRVDGAEIDPEVVRLGRRYFDLPPEDSDWLRVFTVDGRMLLECVPAHTRYHVIVVDAFANELYVPFHLATREFFSLCLSRLQEGGILAMNVYASDPEAPNLAAIESTMASAFPSVLRVPHYATGGYLLLARRGDSSVPISRLAREAVRRRYSGWTGFADWQKTREWEELLALAGDIRATAETHGRTIERSTRGPVLTDDHAPLAWLTDRFLRAAETELRAAGDARSLAVAALRRRQRVLLTVVGAGWAAALAGLCLLARRRERDPPPA